MSARRSFVGGRQASGHRNLVTLGIHALGIAMVVALLQRIGRRIRGAGARHGAAQQADSRTYAGSAAAASNGRARGRTDYRADGRARHAAVGAGLVGVAAADLRAGELPAIAVVKAKLVETLAGAGQ